VARQGPGEPHRWMAARDRIRLIDLLRKSPASAGFFYWSTRWELNRLGTIGMEGGDLYGTARRGRPATHRQRSTLALDGLLDPPAELKRQLTAANPWPLLPDESLYT
jgi:hypothetical protein